MVNATLALIRPEGGRAVCSAPTGADGARDVRVRAHVPANFGRGLQRGEGGQEAAKYRQQGPQRTCGGLPLLACRMCCRE